jgi:IS30 family transposase
VGRKPGARSYFCNPCHPWEKGGVEGANGLLGHYLPKGMSFEGIDNELNTRPRKTLGYKRPVDYLTKL